MKRPEWTRHADRLRTRYSLTQPMFP
jgi:hypothetical protein